MSRHTIPILVGNDNSKKASCIETFQKLPQEDLHSWLAAQQERGLQLQHDNEKTLLASSNTDAGSVSFLVIGRPLDTIAPLDDLLNRCNSRLTDGGTLCCVATPAAVKRQQLRQRWPWGIHNIAVATHHLWHHVAAKLWISRGLYRLVTGEHHRSMSRVEILGRLRHAGFDITYQHVHGNTLTLCATRIGDPILEPPHIGAFIGLPRIGKGGKQVRIYKIRTMHAYSEFLQADLYNRHHLTRKGKIQHDYRVTFVGHWLRKHWIDEWPMLFNLLRGDIKLVGVRPLSESFFRLYSPEMQRLRTQYKPGLLPPLYAQPINANNLDSVQESERQYLEAYAQHPLRTDWHYFWRIVGNIVFRRRRSA